MTSDLERDIRNEHSKTISLVHYLFGTIIFLAGLVARLYAYNKQGFAWEAVRDIGSFVSVTMAVAFVYERLIHVKEQRLFLAAMDELLERRMLGEQRGIKVYTHRPPLEDKLEVVGKAKIEVTELGTALRTFVSYFEQRSESEYKAHVTRLLKEGVDFRCVMIDPEWAAGHGLHEESQKAAHSLAVLRDIATEFAKAGYAGKFEILLYQHEPTFAAIVADGDSPGARMFFTPYLYKTPNAEAPSFLISKSHHADLFSKFWDRSIKPQLSDARPDGGARP